jgi:1,4-dihydroxy-2-naphthoate octaprenyltransferase
LNQLPDVEPDRAVGRRTLPVVIGRRRSVIVYGVQLLLAYLVILVGWLVELLPAGCLIALATAALAVVTVRRAWRHARSVPGLIPALGLNVAINLLTPLLLAVGFFIFGRSAG